MDHSSRTGSDLVRVSSQGVAVGLLAALVLGFGPVAVEGATCTDRQSPSGARSSAVELEANLD